DEAALLRHVRAEVVAQCRVQQMRGAVVGADAVAALGVDYLVHGLANRQLALRNLRAKHMELAELLRRILNLAFEAFQRCKLSGVADLAAALAIKGRLIKQDLDGFADLRALDP